MARSGIANLHERFHNDRMATQRQAMRRAGFTLTELVIVVLIAFIGIGLAITFLGRNRDRANRVVCMNHLRMVGSAMQRYGDVHQNGDGKPFLPPSRIAEGYATWAVLLAPLAQANHPLEKWDLTKPFADQPAEIRLAPTLFYICPARARTAASSGEEPRRGAVGDYAAAWPDGEPKGGIVPATVTKKQGDAILEWRGRVTLADLKRGVSTTILFGEKHVPRGRLNEVEALDGPIADGGVLASHARFAGEKYPLAETTDDPPTPIFGSWHDAVTNFLLADGSVDSITRQMAPELLARKMRLEN